MVKAIKYSMCLQGNNNNNNDILIAIMAKWQISLRECFLSNKRTRPEVESEGKYT